ncbi:type IV pilus secretin PilQ family protein [Alkalimonas collagenimarina]|uniref:Type IV pilus secretin PilQ family protein n=1 Tax=Alkalimonas collagenimarina TaxID=400390 RepID=A0ABT9H1U2_9GAMM|nr:type IV pilus secretin PilQ family protein [Alkalimonas collagenimarina]MDP4537288.1 type IV pilus secretin PilQ family protein [Alkalimonas collagenimarina]
MDKITKTKTSHFICAMQKIALLLLFVAVPASAKPILNDVRYSPLMSGETELEFVFNDRITATPEVQVFNQPARIELFFGQTGLDDALANIDVERAGIQRIQSYDEDNGTRAVIYLDHLSLYQTRQEDNVFYLHITQSDGVSVPGQQSDIKPRSLNDIQAIDFRRGERGEGRVLVFLRNNTAAVNVSERAGKLHVDFHNTSIPDDMLYLLDVMDFGTIVKQIETFHEDGVSRLVIEPSGAFTHNYQQIDNIFTLDVQRDETQRSILGGRDYQGQAISLNFQDIPVRTVLQIIADYNGFNLVTSDSVTGNVTLRLDGVPWDQALDIVLRVRGLDKRMDGNILMVAPTDELAGREARELQAQLDVENLEPLYSDFLVINYAKAIDIASLLRNQDTSLLTSRGAVTVDERTNTILIRDTTRSIENARRLVERLDIPVRQVLIESRMVTVTDNVQEDLGIRWGFSDQQRTKGTSGTAAGANTIAGGVVPSLDQRWNVNLPVQNPAGNIAFHVAKLSDGTILDLELSALEQENKAEIIASPRVTTSNQKMARIEQGTEIPYVQAASSGATTVTFKKAVLSLEVTPQITPDNRIILDLVITQDTRGDTVQTPTGPATAINTQRIQTQVLVDNGETIVLGGIYQQQAISAVSKVPLFGDIPYVGRLFKNTSEFNEKTELLIFVTPRILSEGQ